MPTYPFQRQSYWFHGTEDTQEQQQGRRRSRASSDEPYLLYAPSWNRTPNLSSRPVSQTESSWLIFSDDFGVGSQMATELIAQGCHVTTVARGPELSLGDSFTINPGVQSHYDALISHLKSLDKTPDYIIHLWTLTDSPPAGLDDFERDQYAGLYSLLFLAQSLESSDVGKRVRLIVASNDVHEVTGLEAIHPAKTTTLAACRVIPQESPDISCRHIDIELDDHTARNKDLAAQLIKEASFDSTDPFVAYRGRHRWAQQFEPLASRVNADLPLKHDGVYLITGGLGELGRVLAGHLAEKFAARLVLVGRTPLPETKALRAKLEIADENASVRFILEEVRKLEAKGAEVLLLQADVSDEAKMRGVIDRAHLEFGRLDGIIHAAGLQRGELLRSIQETSPGYCAGHFLPKAQGAATLAKVLQSRELDFVVLISSLSSILGGLGMFAYSAANTAVDAIAATNNRHQSTRWLSMNLDGLNLADQPDDHGDQNSLLNASKVIAAFEDALALSEEPQILVSATDLYTRLDRWINPAKEESLPVHKKTGQTLHQRPSLQTEYVEARDDLERRLVEIWQNLLGIAPIGVRDSFFDLGGHSLLMTQLVSKVRAATKVTIPLRSLVELPTLEQLAQAIRAMAVQESSDARESQLVEIQRGGPQPPLFCVHPLGGGVSVFIDLARHLGPDQPFYAFQAADLETLSKVGSAYNSIEDMASHYLNDLIKVQAAGPYLLAGLSFGGQVAFEMAQQLTARGETVAFLGLLDTYAPNPAAPAPDEETLLVGFAQELAAAAGKDIDLTAADLRPGEREANLARVMTLLMNNKLIARNTDISTIGAFLSGVRTRIETSRGYSPKVYGGKVTLFRASDTGSDLSAWVDIADPSYGWSRFTEREVEIIEVPGTHATICVPPQVEILARRMAACMKEAYCAVPSVA